MKNECGRNARIRHICRTWALATGVAVAALGGIAVVGGAPAMAQTEALAEVKQFDIPAGPLAEALMLFGRQSGLQVSADDAAIGGVEARAVSGAFAPKDALARLLSGTGITYIFTGKGTVTIAKPSDGTLLSPITVEGRGLRDPGSTEGTHSYAGSHVTVGAKTPTSIREVPQSVSVITRRRMDDRNMTTLQDALAETTGVKVDRFDDTRANFYARGYKMSVLRDGSQLPHSEQFDAAPDLAIYDRVEVLRGPAGMFNGAGEPGGSINLARKRAGTAFLIDTDAHHGSWDFNRVDADMTGPLVESGKIRGRLVGAVEDRKSFLDAYEATKWLGYGTIDMDLTRDTELSVGGVYHDNDTPNYQGLPAFYDDGGRIDLPRHTRLSTEWDKWNERATEGFAELKHKFENDIEIVAQGRGAYRVKKGYANTTFSSIERATGDVDVLAGKYDWRQEDYSLDTYASVPVNAFGQKQQFLLGADYTYTTFNRKQGFTSISLNAFDTNHNHPLPSIVFNNLSITDTEEIGSYGQARLKPGVDWMTLIVGGRLTWWNSVVDDVDAGTITADTNVNGYFTPNLGVVADVSKEVSVYGSYAGIFQPQTNQTPSGEIVEPREGFQYEIGSKGEFMGGALNAHVAGYWLEDKNRATTISGCAGNQCSEAAGLVRSVGIEAEVSGEPMPGWSVFAGYGFNRTKYIDDPSNKGNLLNPEIPRHLFNLSTEYRITDGVLSGFSIGGGMKFTSMIFRNLNAPYNRLEQGSVITLNGSLGYEFMDSISARLTVDNILDEEYYERIWDHRGNNRWGEPRAFMLSVNATW